MLDKDDFREDEVTDQNTILQDKTMENLGFKASDNIDSESDDKAEDYMPPTDEEKNGNAIACEGWEALVDLMNHPGFSFLYFGFITPLIDKTEQALLNPDLNTMEINNKPIYTAHNVNCIMLQFLKNLRATPTTYMKELQALMNETNSLFVQKTIEDFYEKTKKKK